MVINTEKVSANMICSKPNLSILHVILLWQIYYFPTKSESIHPIMYIKTTRISISLQKKSKYKIIIQILYFIFVKGEFSSDNKSFQLKEYKILIAKA